MLRTLFPRYYARYERSLCSDEMEKFGCWLLDTGYSHKNTRNHLRRFRYAFEQADQSGSGTAFTQEQLISVFAVRQGPTWRSLHYAATRRAYERFLISDNRLIVTKSGSPAWIECLDNYEQFLCEVRGLAEPTVDQHLATVSELLTHSLLSKHSIADLTSEHVDLYLESKSVRITRQTMQHVVARLRAFLRHSFDQGILTQRLDRIDRPRTYRDEKPPRAMPWPLVLDLLRSIDRKSKAGWRDFTILHLMAHYGLRPSEIASLTLSSIDLKGRLLHVEQRKTRSQLTLPLSGSTVRVLQSYLKRGRTVSTHTSLFLRARRPTGGLKHYAVCNLFEKRVRECGLPTGQYSSYSLRHAFAMRLLQRGVGVKAIGDLMGHRSLESTCVYLRLDIKTLRTVALPVPQQVRTEV